MGNNDQRLTHAVAPVVLLHDVLAVEHLVADLAGVQLLAVLLLVLGQVAVGGEEARADVALERLVVCGRGRGGGLKCCRSWTQPNAFYQNVYHTRVRVWWC